MKVTSDENGAQELGRKCGSVIAWIVNGVAVEVPKHSQSFSDFIEGKKAGQQ
jgi:hypothetical protein